ncbi:asparaginase [Leucobacter sp. M11]|uniref:asparaginase n=1 Tax=Leucobacter sp. M11 TaxID=2993565 RepID=UPI002D804940|nr:asparaginase [Leucobacter sp. M11]MEB4615653.1 asparaginase [Leucobacter sp. M11]
MSRGTATVSQAVELATVSRNGFVESRHAGSAVVLSSDGEVIRELGAPEEIIFTRSALKPLQSLAMQTNGLVLGDTEEIAISLASHTGTPGHIAIVERMLSSGGLVEDQLLCPADWPMDQVPRDAVIAAGGTRRRAAMCCSGKHAAMLLTCVANDWSIDDYTNPEHPLQQAIRDTVQRFTGERPAPIGVDGCGAPVLGLSLTGLARGVRRIATSELSSPFPLHRTAATIIAAARQHPWVVEGPGRTDTIVSEQLGVFAKFGAEGISVMTAPNGVTVAVKVLDGASRAASIAALELLVQAEALDRAAVEQLLPSLRTTVLGGGAPVGEIRASF